MPKDSGSWFKMPGMGGNKTEVLDGDAPQVALPSADYAADAVYVQDGMDLRMTGPDGQVVIIRGYFDGDPPVLTTPEGGQLSPSLVRSFVTPEHAGEYAGPMGDAPAVGEVYKLEGDAWVTHADGTKEQLELGTPIFQGDVIETGPDGAVNILFDDETRFAVSKDARLSIDEFNFAEGEGGESNFSMLKGVFVYTSGLIGKEDPDDVEINTPVGSIGIRGTVVGGVIDSDGSEITVIEGAITFTNSGGTVVLDESNETLVASDFDSTATNIGTMDSTHMESTYSSLSGVANDMYGAITTQEANGQTEGTTDSGETTEATEATDTTETTESTDSTTEAAPDGGSEPAPETAPAEDGTTDSTDESSNTETTTTDDTTQLAADDTTTTTDDGSGDVLIGEEPSGTDTTLSSDSTLSTNDTTTTDTTTADGSTNTTSDGGTLPPPPPPGDTTTADGGTTTTAPPPPPPNLLPDVTGTLPNAALFQSENSISFDFSSLFTDPEGSAVDVSIQSPLAPWMTFDATTGILTGTPADLDFGIYQIAVRGTDEEGAFRETAFTFTVADNDGDIDLTSVTGGGNGFSLIGNPVGSTGDFLGADVAGVGDINNDGFEDVMVGAPGTNEAYVIFGSPEGIPRNVDVTNLNGTNGFTITGITGGLGFAVNGLGDIDGDGRDDYAIGAPEANSLDPSSGGAYILYGEFIGPGGTSFGSTLDLSTDLADFGTGGLGFSFGDYNNTGLQADQGGVEIAGIGDFNSDGYEDFVVTVPGADPTSSESGVTRLVFGGQYLSEGNIGAALQPGTDTMPNLPDLNGETGTAFYGSQTSALLGWSASGGDLNGDGLNDLAMGSPGADKVYLAYGQAGTFNNENIVDLSDGTAIDTNNVVVFEGIAGSNFGTSLALNGDLNGDGYNDLVVGADMANSGDGAVYIFNGSNAGFAGGLSSAQDVATGDHDHAINGGTGDFLGYSVDYAGDFNGDGYDDLVVGADDGSSQSNAYILWGGAGGISLTNIGSGTPADGMNIFTTDYTGLGFSVSGAGDVNGDGFDDVIIGAPVNGGSGEGGSTIIYGGNYTGDVDVMGTDRHDLLDAINGAGQDVIVAGDGDDRVLGDGGADVYRLGSGNDKVAISDSNYMEIDGGYGEDELYLNGAFTLDLTAGGTQGRVDGIEIFNMANGLTNTLRLGLEDILQSDINEIVVLGDNSDTFTADFSDSNFVQSGTSQQMVDQGLSTDGNFQIFSNDAVTVLVDVNIGNVNVTV